MKTILTTLGTLIALGSTPVFAASAFVETDALPSTFQPQSTFPTRPLTLVVPFPPGGATDAIGRVVANQLGKELGQTIQVENRAGAGTAVGAGVVAQAAPDGYTLLISSGTTFTIAPALRDNLPYDPIESFEPIGIVGRTGLVLLAFKNTPVENLSELANYMKGLTSDKRAYGSFGTGSSAHFVGAAFASAAGIDMPHTPFRGSLLSMTELLAREIPLIVDTVPASLEQKHRGNVRVLAISAPQRSAFMPDVPTFAEQGFPSVAMDTWLMVAAPRGLPADVKNRLEQALRTVVDSEDMRASLANRGFEAAYVNAADSEALIRDELPRMRDVAQTAGIKGN